VRFKYEYLYAVSILECFLVMEQSDGAVVSQPTANVSKIIHMHTEWILLIDFLITQL